MNKEQTGLQTEHFVSSGQFHSGNYEFRPTYGTGGRTLIFSEQPTFYLCYI
jgi:hypothetical protein